MKELMENGPVQGKCPSSCSLVSEACAYLRLSTAAQVVGTALSSKSIGAGNEGTMYLPHGQHPWRWHLESWYEGLRGVGRHLQTPALVPVLTG